MAVHSGKSTGTTARRFGAVRRCSRFAATLAFGLLSALLGTWTSGAGSQPYPSRAVRLVVPFAPGGGTDIVARVIAQRLSAALSQSVVVDNRTGGGTTLGTGIAAAAAPDGYTLVIVASTFTADAALYPKLSYHPIKSFSPVARVTDFPFVLVAHPSMPAQSVGDLVQFARENPGKLNYASGSGSAPARLGMELFKWLTHVDIVGIPYKGAGPAVTALLGGETQLLFSTLPAVLPHIRSGRLRALAMTTPVRYHALPDLPTIAESGVPGYDYTSWHGVLAPAGTAPAIVLRLNSEINKIMGQAEVREPLVKLGLDAALSTPEEFSSLIKAEAVKWTRLIKEARILAD
jgi:tripartite-type tricarboxylate transporter receptor subunit TctC